jgi:hypothetical protein
VRSAGAVPSTIAGMIRGHKKVRGANKRMCRSPWASRSTISAKEAMRPSLISYAAWKFALLAKQS